ncbi:cysteine synthase [Aerococcus loyolae]|uniref:Cysteine synthase n=2 Tax=Aerococcus TaxID=1375 RepID=A0A2I1L8T0_9LACT|nr:pyridoxal-phosphate dependent enzyme [Aerococcus loyolae]KAA9266070.1 pyridoxal-phosphate dependent enzyme [Aerococcus loyolae]PKY86940.1 cysteine synthase [Aerococcus loyolae]PKZ04287.1 cysteine synthase [Aerococcus loyolae]RAV66477.1 cysteine synthase [Aerococcus loyolae]
MPEADEEVCKMVEKLDNLLLTIGETPLIKLQRSVPYQAADVYVKLEKQNPTGHIKDRSLLNLLEVYEERGDLTSGTTLVVCADFVTIRSLACLAAIKGYDGDFFLNEVVSEADLKTLREYGMTIHPLSDPDKVTEQRQAAIESGQKEETLLLHPDSDYACSVVHQLTTGPEIIEALDGKAPNAFVSAVSTGASLSGIGRALKEASEKTAIYAVETSGQSSLNDLDMASDLPLLDTSLFAEIIRVQDGRAYQEQEWLKVNEGLEVDFQSALAITGAIALAERLGRGHKVVTIANGR